MNRAFPLSLFLLAMPTTATALDLSKPGYAVFYENGRFSAPQREPTARRAGSATSIGVPRN